MDQCYLVIATLGTSETENAEVLSIIQEIEIHLKDVVLTSGNNTKSLGSNVKPKVCSRPKYLSTVIYTDPSAVLCTGYKPIEWNLCFQTSDFCENFVNNRTPSKGKKSNDQQTYLSDVIHQLCDELPLMGTCVVDVIWVTQKAEGLQSLIKEKVEVFGALTRLIHWHRAKLTCCCCQGDISPCVLTILTGLLPFQILRRPFLWNEILYVNVVWRGGIHLHNQSMDGFQLGYTGSAHPSIVVEGCGGSNNNIFPKISNDPNAPEQLCLENFLTILGKYPLSIIPPHMVSAKRLELSLPDSPLLENSSEFLAAVNSDADICFLLRLGIWETSNRTDDKRMDTKTWKDRVVSGNYKVYKDIFTKEVDHRFLLLIGDGLNSKQSASVFVMRDVNDYNPKTCLQMAITDAQYPSHQETSVSIDLSESFLTNLKTFSSQDVKQLGETLLEKQIWGLQLLIEKMGNEVPAAYARAIMKDIGSQVIFEFKPSNLRKSNHKINERDQRDSENSHHFGNILEYDEPANWPEKVFLKMMGKRSNFNGDSEQRTSEITFLKMGELAERLHSLEKCKENFWDDPKKEPINSAPPLDKLTSWPEAQYCNFHDVFYCKDQSCFIKQQKMNYIEAKYISYDTASSHENIPEGQERELTPRLQSLIRIQDDKVVDKMPHRKSARLRSPVLQAKTTNHRLESKPDNHRKGSSDGLSEKNLQKLRVAVVDALELYNIRGEHPLFKTCAKKLFTICKTFAKDVIGSGSASKRFMAIAESHVQQVIHFETNRPPPISSKRISS